jgi:acyl-coenzyme A synthetase/AMP-(fatty) acid ligase
MGELNYEKECKNWKWNIPSNYNIGYDTVDKHAEGKNKDKIALFWENLEGKTKKFTFK